MRLLEPTYREWTPGNRDIVAMMSGGVDSSVTALLLKEQGWNVVGITMKIPVAKKCDVKRSCCGMEAAYACKALDIPHYYLDVAAEFQSNVIEPFRRAYIAGITPSPCVDCNVLKFGLVWDYLTKTLGVKDLATGHYARIIQCDGEVCLTRASDKSRDQSYFLCEVPRAKLPYLHLPLGELTKTQVRKIARDARLPVARRQDSMELCFAGEGDYRNALGGEFHSPGPILDADGSVIGQHDGIANYTIGQRKGIGIAAKKPLFVWKIDPASNSITVAERERLFTNTVTSDNFNFLVQKLFPVSSSRFPVFGKIRSQGEPTPCEVIEAEESLVTVKFDEPQFAPTPGQRLVLYSENGVLIGGGTIKYPNVDSPSRVRYPT